MKKTLCYRYLLCFTILQHGTPLENLIFLDGLVQQFYKEHPVDCKYRNMSKLTMFMRKSGGPKLRGKAIEVRNFCKVLLHLWQKFHNPNLLVHKQILLYLKLSYKVDAILDRHKGEFALSGPVAAEFEKPFLTWVIWWFCWKSIFQLKMCHIFSQQPLSCMGLPIRLSGQNMFHPEQSGVSLVKTTCIMYRFWHSPA